MYFFSGEIDRCLKKVAEGVEQFEEIWKKASLYLRFHTGIMYGNLGFVAVNSIIYTSKIIS